MDNVTTLESEERRLRYFKEDSNLYFDVKTRDMFYEDGNGFKVRDLNHRAVVRAPSFDNTARGEAQIGMVGNKYNLIPTKDLCVNVEQAFCRALNDQELEDVQVHDRTSYGGGACIRTYVFPGVRVDINSEKSDIAFRTILLNSYDGSGSFKMYSGAIDFFCANGMISGEYDVFVHKHTSGLTVPDVTQRVKRTLEVFYTSADMWRQWVGKVITDEQVKTMLEQLHGVSERRAEQFMSLFHDNSLTHGRTVWALYSAFTAFASHAEGDDRFRIKDTGEDNEAVTLLNRERDVTNWVASDAFQQLAA